MECLSPSGHCPWVRLLRASPWHFQPAWERGCGPAEAGTAVCLPGNGNVTGCGQGRDSIHGAIHGCLWNRSLLKCVFHPRNHFPHPRASSPHWSSLRLQGLPGAALSHKGLCGGKGEAEDRSREASILGGSGWALRSHISPLTRALGTWGASHECGPGGRGQKEGAPSSPL